MKIVSSHIVTKSDYKRFYEGYVNNFLFAQEDYLELLNGATQEVRSRLDKLVPWLVAKGYITLQIAVVEKSPTGFLYHEKLGCFENDKEVVAFSGSANETFHALHYHFEVVDVFRSWVPEDERRVKQKQADFNNLWNNTTDGLTVYSFVEAARRGLLQIRATSPPRKDHNADFDNMEDEANKLNSGIKPSAESLAGLEEVLYMPPSLTLYAHQKNAVRAWLQAKGRGVFEMATGSGKTITALTAATKLYEVVGGPLAILILCPYIHLVDQWVSEAKLFGLAPLACSQGRANWETDYHARLYAAKTCKRKIISLIASNSTFRSVTFQELLKSTTIPLLIIGDEMHNLGAIGLRQLLPKQALYRLGLSATPQRRYDSEGSNALFSYFGQSVAKYTLGDALKDGVLTRYRYYPHLVPLTEDEVVEYNALTKKIARAFGGGDIDEPSTALERLLIQRARLVATAENKLHILRRLMESHRQSHHNLIYCGDGQVEVVDTDEEERQIKAVTRMLGIDLGMQVATYTAETPLERRRQLRTDFSNGNLQALVAIRCLDEGVDIPETRRAFIIASVTDPRQYVQRRGRVLRRAPGKDMAEIHDFLVAPPEEHQVPDSPYYDSTRRLFGRELERVVEFAELAENGPEALGQLLAIRERLQLLSFGVEPEKNF